MDTRAFLRLVYPILRQFTTKTIDNILSYVKCLKNENSGLKKCAKKHLKIDNFRIELKSNINCGDIPRKDNKCVKR